MVLSTFQVSHDKGWDMVDPRDVVMSHNTNEGKSPAGIEAQVLQLQKI